MSWKSLDVPRFECDNADAFPPAFPAESPRLGRSMLRALLHFVIAFVTSIGVAAEPEPLTFETHVRPILKAHCWQCHGEEEKLEGHFDARLARFLLKGG